MYVASPMHLPKSADLRNVVCRVPERMPCPVCYAEQGRGCTDERGADRPPHMVYVGGAIGHRRREREESSDDAMDRMLAAAARHAQRRKKGGR